MLENLDFFPPALAAIFFIWADRCAIRHLPPVLFLVVSNKQINFDYKLFKNLTHSEFLRRNNIEKRHCFRLYF